MEERNEQDEQKELDEQMKLEEQRESNNFMRLSTLEQKKWMSHNTIGWYHDGGNMK